ncbi:pyridoxal 5'-phosphate synthase glutaminase subunit PdxT [Rhodococcus erythropolis]|jgi:pyridoxal 5'-phosphate synthase pdxT subunit|uniref:Pyridoxal 5'-phosphate synthase subunit PdxT n=1 Tax=Rhodococcus baikonurensis TaxID=172041 RepID=A0ABV5XNJ8_9NOCA|nr:MULTISPECIES: pyridoxal 5'-phosphate synthase glutaminase subunit PdxT [Rhodococcus]MBJ7481373.1 pyridoxal 5'-phosphate synthase glutaminase subunit PdxT [Rhodococcus sp. (in: high G+C Gram-positive bacteria)]MDI9956491.1 pyridoxal 5'-phosphate synthase glutaminase subunit PdxT [Rhodococcus sp. IEGM 1237]MDI9964099.1 pyridoxal 5'-phosphate synthase glutaminase subunit PdxT [Rhodococcus sp. IEGM 1251]MDV8124454.1 pyridoxal 5'-phosphate synthase glutaminase subunit PdxT [Rhodococcus sp. IEGM 1
MTRPLIGVLALQGDVREHLAALDDSGADAVGVRRPEELDKVDGIVIPGGESTTMSRLLQVFELLEPLRERLRGGLPAYGSCAGMILLASEVLDTRPDAEHLGAIDMTVRRNAFGRQVDSFESDLEFEGIIGDPIRAVFIRAPWVERVGPGVEVLAQVPAAAGEAAGRIVAVRQGSVIATSFHPEVTGDRRVHEMFVDLVRG